MPREGNRLRHSWLPVVSIVSQVRVPAIWAHDMVCVDECSGSASVRAMLAGLSLALEPEPAHGLGFAQVVRA